MPVELIAAARAAGVVRLGENRVKEAEGKIAAFPDVEWHLVGRLQANKARRAVECFSVVQTIDAMALARRVDRIAGELARGVAVYLQVNVDGDPAKAGFDPAGLEAVIDELAALEHLDLAGLMTVGRAVSTPEAARPTFVALRRLAERLRARTDAIGDGLSMGMSEDYEVAVEEGATLVRVGRAIFGDRPAA
jgi:hypothetical protein